MPRKDKSLCRYRGCQKKARDRALWCNEHTKNRAPDADVPIKFKDIQEINARAGKLVDWIQECLDYMTDMVNDTQSVLRQFQYNMQPDDAREHWMVTFEAEKWMKNLKFDALLELEQIRILLYGGDA